MARAIRGLGWLLLVSGVIVLLYVVYLLWFTGLGTAEAQRDLAEQWQAQMADDPVEPTAGDQGDADEELPAEAYAQLWFERDGQPVVVDDPLYVVTDVTLDALRDGPGHYPDSAAPGEDGNAAIAGHRTTYGAPFGALDELREGDTIHVVDRDGREWVYEYAEERVVAPGDTWVVEEEDPLDRDAPTLTLTTCHPRFSAAQRLIVWGELRDA